MSLKYVKSELVPITLDVAKSIRDMACVPGERELFAKRAKNHVDNIRRNVLYDVQWGRCSFRGTLYRVNGNHTSNVICCCMMAHREGGFDSAAEAFFNSFLKTGKGGYKQPEDLPEVKDGDLLANLQDWVATTRSSLTEAFQKYDSHLSARTSKDIVNVCAREHDDLEEISARNIKRAIGGIVPVINSNPTLWGLHPDQRLEVSSPDEVLMVDLVRDCIKWLFESVPDRHLYGCQAGIILLAELFCQRGSDEALQIVDSILEVKDIEGEPKRFRDVREFWKKITEKSRTQTVMSVVNRGRKAVKAVERSMLVA